MYLSKRKLLFSQLFSWIIILATAFIILLGISGIGLCISAMNGDYSVVQEDEIGSHLAVYIGFIIVPGCFLLWAVRTLILSGKAYKFNSLFEADPDGVVSVEKTARLFGKPVDKFIDLFGKLVKKGFLINCSLENPDEPVIVLNNGAEKVEDRFDVVKCPSCGAPNNIRLGFVGNCKYCSSKLTEDNTQN